ncbi:MAG TPA: amino acid adenylation domain-containing protein, partial [Pyrinomonadaceae bacterium]|nr:amino acid adenylation domain-containing protein [Pyrinomonadaceae bacterium]
MKLKNVEDIYDLSPIQQGLLFHSLYAPDSGVYVQQIEWVLRGELNLKAFEQAWQQVVNRHSTLRTCFFWEDLDKPLQVVRQSVKLRIAIDDWSELSASEQQSRLVSFLEADRRRGFELSRAPLLRLALVRLDDQRHRLILSNHHLLLDGWSIPLLLKEVFIFYQGVCRNEPVQLPQPRSYRDYIFWLQNQPLEEAERYWREKLRGLSSPTTLALGRGAVARVGERGEGAEGEYREQWLSLNAAETAELNAAARRHKLTLNTIAQGAWSILLSRYSGEQDVVFGMTVAGRPAGMRGVEQMVGLFINTLPLRVRINERERVSELLKGLQAEAVEMRQYEHSPLLEVAKWSEIPRGIPLFESVLAFENYPTDASFGEQIRQSTGLEVLDVKAHERGNHSLAAVVYPAEHELHFKIEYEHEQFDDETIRRMLEHFRQLLSAIITDPQQRVCDLQLLTDSEREQLLVEFNGTSAEFPQDVCLHQLIEQQVARTPEEVAVVLEEEEVSYRELNERANQLAHHLRSLGVGPEIRVGILLERSVEMVVALLGVLKAGGAYVPLDPEYPAERLRFMLEDSQVSVLITDGQLEGTLPPHTAHLLRIDDEAEMLRQYKTSNPELVGVAENLAYIIYTSGSTGQPKGALITHASLVNYVTVISRDFGLTPSDGFAQIASASFDVAVEEIFPALVSGARVVLCREIPYAKDFLGVIARKKLTAFELPTAFWHEWVYELSQSGEQLPECVRLVVVGGEKNLPDRFATWQRLVDGHVSLIHVFGLTETTITSTTYKPSTANAAEDVKHSLPIGRPLANTQIRILDAQMRLAPIGVAGELYIGGPGVARGYNHRADLTAERFLPDLFSSEAGARMYRTGDLARYLENGEIEFIKRIDEQVKVRGYRIELGEVEAALREQEGVRECVVVARQEEGSAARLVGYVVLEAGATFSVTALRQGLLRRLPEYMIPASFVQLEELPLTPNGKVDRRALPDPDHQRPALETVQVGPSTAAEETLVKIWSEVLGLSEVGIHDNFFEVGGDSILSIQIVARANQAGLQLAPKHLFEFQTVAELARVAEQAAAIEKPAEDSRARVKEILDVALTPIQRWFFAQNFAQPHHWNQSLLFEVRQQLSGAVLRQVMGWLVERHDGLRLRFVRAGEKWQQRLSPASSETGASTLTEIDLSEVARSAQREALERAAA